MSAADPGRQDPDRQEPGRQHKECAMDELVLAETQGAVRLLTLNRPAKLNALNPALVQALTEALLTAQSDDEVAVVVLAGAGRAFCAGADTSARHPLTAENRPDLIRRGDANIALTMLLARVDKPIIAAVHGYALGAGCGLALGSDLTVAAESARFGYPELKAGLAASTVTAQAVHLMGRKVAFELLTLCDTLLPQRAYELGLVNRVVPDDRLLDEAIGMAEKLAGWNKEFLWQTKRTFHRAVALAPEQALEMARDVAVMMGRLPAVRGQDAPAQDS
jgi:enoyl-CoA hydratase/carnithine racemase